MDAVLGYNTHYYIIHYSIFNVRANEMNMQKQGVLLYLLFFYLLWIQIRINKLTRIFSVSHPALMNESSYKFLGTVPGESLKLPFCITIGVDQHLENT